MSDDLGMSALSGGFGERAAGVIAAGTDIALHCSGDLAEMESVAGAVGAIGDVALERLDRAMATIVGAAPVDSFDELVAKRDALLASGVTPPPLALSEVEVRVSRRCACSTSFDFAQDERVEGLAGTAIAR